jgi:hypothetical protein
MAVSRLFTLCLFVMIHADGLIMTRLHCLFVCLFSTHV